MAELGIIASIIQIADVGLRLSIKLYTFGEIVASADRSVISISKDVSLTSSVLKELGQILDKDGKSHILSKNAVDTADAVVKECLEVFEEMETILVKKLPNLRTQGAKTPKAVLLLERLKCNESPSVIADQKSLIEDLARSNQQYIQKYEKLRLAIVTESPEPEQYAQAGSQNRDLGSTLSQHLSFNAVDMTNSVQNISLSREAEVQTSSAEAPDAKGDALLTHLEHYLRLLNNLLNEVDKLEYEIADESRFAMKDALCRSYNREMRDLAPQYDIRTLNSVEERLAPLVATAKKRREHAKENITRIDAILSHASMDTLGPAASQSDYSIGSELVDHKDLKEEIERARSISRGRRARNRSQRRVRQRTPSDAAGLDSAASYAIAVHNERRRARASKKEEEAMMEKPEVRDRMEQREYENTDSSSSPENNPDLIAAGERAFSAKETSATYKEALEMFEKAMKELGASPASKAIPDIAEDLMIQWTTVPKIAGANRSQ
ncbi:hypothetical protein P7C71_g6103, partial [Lecanoromycetidae sp. Uapishka_2]